MTDGEDANIRVGETTGMAVAEEGAGEDSRRSKNKRRKRTCRNQNPWPRSLERRKGRIFSPFVS